MCNKCGPYECTHLRARPLRFDELGTGNKARKGGKVGSPKGGAARRCGVSSTGSSSAATSDWDDSGLFSLLPLSFRYLPFVLAVSQ